MWHKILAAIRIIMYKMRICFNQHNSIRDVTAKVLRKACRDVQLKPPLQPLTGEELCGRLAITTNEAPCDVNARGFWSASQVAFLNVSVFNPNPNRYVN